MFIETRNAIISATPEGSYVYWHLYPGKIFKDSSSVIHGRNFRLWFLAINMGLLRSHDYWFWLLLMTPAGSYVYRKREQEICATPAGSYVYWNLYQRKYPKIPPLKSGAGMTSSPGGWVEAEVERHATPPGSWTYMTGLLSINMWLLRSHNYWFWLLLMTPAGSYVYRKREQEICATPAGSYVYWHLYPVIYSKIPPPEVRGRNDIVSGWMGWGWC